MKKLITWDCKLIYNFKFALKLESVTKLKVKAGILKQIPAFNFFCASLESISAIENTWEWCRIANMALIQLGGNSRVVEMILARVSSGFAGEKFYGRHYIVLGITSAAEEGWHIISQDKYVVEILKKFGFTEVKTASTPMETQKPLLKDEDGEEVDVSKCLNFSVADNSAYFFVLITPFSSIVGQMSRPCSTDSSRGKAKKSVRLMMEKLFGMELELILFHALVDGKKIIISEASVRKDLKLEDEEGGGPRCQETIGNTISQTMFENVSKLSNDSLLKVLDLEKTKTTQSNEIASLKRRVKKLKKKKSPRTHKLKRLYKVGLSVRVESFKDKESLGEDASKQGRINVIEADEDITLVNIQDDVDKEMYDVGTVTGDEVFAEQEVAAKDVNLTIDEVTLAQALAALKSVKPKVKGDVIEEQNVPVNAANASTKVSTTATTVTITTEEITLAQALEALKTSKPKVKGIVFQEPSTTTTITTISSQQSQDKGKGIMIEEPVKPMKKKVQIMLDEEVALKLQAEFDEEERLAREKAEKEKEANIALIEEWDDIQAKIDVDHQLAERLQAQEQEELSDAEKATLFQQLLEKRRKHFAAKRAEEQRKKPPTQAQQRKIMCTYLKNMKGKNLKDLKNKSFDSIQKMFDRAFKRVNTFVDFRTDLVEGSSKRAGEELEQESTKKQKVDEDKDTTELQSLMDVISNEEEVAIDVVPLATKIFSQMIKSFDREDLEDLYKLVKARYGSTRPVEDLDLVLWNDLKTIFEPHVEDEIYMLVEKRYPFTPPIITDMLNKKLQGRIAGIKSLLNIASITAAHIRVNAA
ncbi:hypothetical protein Tco_0441228 [Tanacetum coccineum]